MPLHDTSSPRFAAVVPVGPGAVGLWRGVEVIRSLVFWEPGICCCVVLDDSPVPRGLADLAAFPSTCLVKCIRTAPAMGGRGNWIGRLTGGIISALQWVQSHVSVEFVLRIDSDALAIGPFARLIQARIEEASDAGVIGTLGLSSHPAVWALEDYRLEPKLLRTSRILAETRHHGSGRTEDTPIPGVGTLCPAQRRAFESIRPHVEAAVSRGYQTNEFCQGGVNVMSRIMLDRMAASGYLTSAFDWAALPFADDRVMAMYAYATEMKLRDYSSPGEPFGVQAIGLPYPPSELVTRGHRLIHSVKNSRLFSELEIRQYFADLRAMRRPQSHI